jgi:hypothetical protein
MTRLSRKLVRLTHSKHNGEDIVIELRATALFLRTKGSRDSFPLSYTELYELARDRAAKRAAKGRQR